MTTRLALRRALAAVVTAAVAASVAVSTGGSPAGAVVPGPRAAAAVSDASGYVALPMTRVLDTRNGTGEAAGTAAGPVPAAHSVSLQVTGVAGVPPSGVTAVAVNLTVLTPAAAGYLVAYAAGTAKPPTSSLSYAAGQAIGNFAIVPVSAAGTITITTSATSQIVADLSGYYLGGAAAQTGGYRAVTPLRALDTRTGAGRPAGAHPSPLSAGQAVSLQIAGTGEIAPTGVAAVAVNLTVLRPAAAGYLVAYADGAAKPPTSSLSYAAGQAVGDFAIVPVGADGKITIRTSAATEVVADIAGYVEAGPAADGGYAASTAARVADTRTGAHPLAAGQPLRVQIAGRAGVPDTHVAAVAVNVTVLAPASSGYLVVGPNEASTPATSSLSFAAGRTIANFALVPVGSDGGISILTSASTQVVVDVVGYVAGPPADTTPPPAITGLSATPTKATIALAWTDPATSGAGSVMIRRTLGSTPPASILAGSLVARLSPTATQYTDTAVSPQNGYSYAVFRYTAPLWSVAALVSTSTLPLTWRTPRPGEMDWVSCASASMCVAVNATGSFTRFNGTSWTAIKRINSAVTNTGSISCPRTTFCLTLDRVTGTAWSYNGSAWTTHRRAGPYTGDVICPTSTSCFSETQDRNSDIRLWTMSGSRWTESARVPGSRHYAPYALSCAATFCAVASYYEIVTKPATPDRLFTYSAGTWRSVAIPTPTVSSYTGVSCVSAALCYILGQFGSAIYRSGHITLLAQHPHDQYEGSVSCVSTSTCVVGMDAGSVRVFNGTSLGATTSVVDTSTTPDPDVLDISCVGPTFCAAVGWFGVNVTAP